MEIMEQNALGPAERILQTVLSFADHAVHNRAGIVIPDEMNSLVGVKWLPVTHGVEEGERVVYELRKNGRNGSIKVRLGKMVEGAAIPARAQSVLSFENMTLVKDGNRFVGRYQPAGIFPEVAAWMYRQVAEVWKLDNEFAAKWASYAFKQEHRDLKVILAAFMLVQSRKGDPVMDGGKMAFHDDDFREVGEAMMLISDRRQKEHSLHPKLLLRIHDILTLPQVAEINRELGFGRSARRPFLGRWTKAVEKWLRYREENPRMLEGLVKAGFRRTVMDLSRKVGYKPTSPKFFELLRWKQSQAGDGRRNIAIGEEVAAAETWEGLTEEEICQTIVTTKPSYKRIVGLLPKSVGLTRAIMAAAIDSGALSNKDLIIATPTLEELGVLDVQEYRDKWSVAVKEADDMRAANIAQRVRSQATKDKLEEAADNAVKAAVEEVVRGMRIYFMVDISGSMDDSIEKAKTYLAKFLQAFPKEQIHISVFNTSGREITLRQNSAAGVTQAFRGISASGGTDYGAGVRALQKYKPSEDEDVLFIFVGDQGASDFNQAVTASGLNPVAFGFLHVPSSFHEHRTAVENTAAHLSIPCFPIDEKIFEDVYAVPRMIHNLISATPVGQTTRARTVQRVSLVDTILSTDLLQKPAWA